MGVEVNFTNNSPEYIEMAKAAAERALIAIGQSAETHAKEYIRDAPAVVTGRLMNSITHAVDMSDNAVYIGTNVEYAKGIETGTHRKKGAVHFLQRAANDHQHEYKSLTEDAFKSVR